MLELKRPSQHALVGVVRVPAGINVEYFKSNGLTLVRVKSEVLTGSEGEVVAGSPLRVFPGDQSFQLSPDFLVTQRAGLLGQKSRRVEGQTYMMSLSERGPLHLVPLREEPDGPDEIVLSARYRRELVFVGLTIATVTF